MSILTLNVTITNPPVNPRLRSEQIGIMACALSTYFEIDDKHYFVDAAFTYTTSDFWTVDQITLINLFDSYSIKADGSGTCHQFDADAKMQIITAIARSMSYDTYSWFTHTICKEKLAGTA